jgi:hypothetical protein
VAETVIKKLPTFYRTRRYIGVFITANHWTTPQAARIHSPSLHHAVVAHFTTLSVSTQYSVGWQVHWWWMNRKGSGRNQSSPNQAADPTFTLTYWRKLQKQNVNQDGQCPTRYSNSGPPKWESRTLSYTNLHSVTHYSLTISFNIILDFVLLVSPLKLCLHYSSVTCVLQATPISCSIPYHPDNNLRQWKLRSFPSASCYFLSLNILLSSLER